MPASLTDREKNPSRPEFEPRPARAISPAGTVTHSGVWPTTPWGQTSLWRYRGCKFFNVKVVLATSVGHRATLTCPRLTYC